MESVATLEFVENGGVTFVTGADIGSTAIVRVMASDFGFLNAWIDFDGNGQFEDGEQVISDWVLDEGIEQLSTALDVAYSAIWFLDMSREPVVTRR